MPFPGTFALAKRVGAGRIELPARRLKEPHEEWLTTAT